MIHIEKYQKEQLSTLQVQENAKRKQREWFNIIFIVNLYMVFTV